MKGVEIIPYTVKEDGSMTFTDAEIMEFYDRIISEGAAESTFYNKEKYTREDFLWSIKHSGCFTYIIKLNDEFVVSATLDGFQMGMAFAHYYTVKKTWGTGINVKIANYFLSTMLHYKDAKGKYLFNVLCGLTPVWHARGLKFNAKIGGIEKCTIENSVWNASKQMCEPGKLFCFTRESLSNGNLH